MYVVNKAGYLTAEFLPFNKETKQLELEKKKTFVISVKNVGDLIDLDASTPYNDAEDSEGVYLQY